VESIVKLKVSVSAEKARPRFPVVGKVFLKKKQESIKSNLIDIFLEQVQVIPDKLKEKGKARG